MLPILFKILPFFMMIGLGFATAKRGHFDAVSQAALTRFVYYFALSAMLFRFSATLDVAEIFDPDYGSAYLLSLTIIYVFVMIIGRVRKQSWAVSSVEAQSAVIGNNGFLAIPMLGTLFGAEAIPYVMFTLVIDLVVFGNLIVIILTVAKEGQLNRKAIMPALRGVISNPMVVSMTLGLLWAQTGIPLADPMMDFLVMLGSAATPCALFVIGASLAARSAERPVIALYLSICKLVMLPALAAYFALQVFDVAEFPAKIMIAVAAMPTAGNIYIIASQFNVAALRVSSTIFVSTVLSVVTLTFVMIWLYSW